MGWPNGSRAGNPPLVKTEMVKLCNGQSGKKFVLEFKIWFPEDVQTFEGRSNDGKRKSADTTG